MQKIRVEVNNEGKVKVLYQGFVGDGCFKQAEKLLAKLKAFGVELASEQLIRTSNYVQEDNQEVVHDGK